MYVNYLFLSVAEIDSGSFKGIAEIEELKASVKADLEKYVKITRSHGFPADYRMNVGTDVVDTVTELVECGSQGVSPVNRLYRKIGFPPREPVPEDPPQRDGLFNSAKAPVGRSGHRYPPHPRQCVRLQRSAPDSPEDAVTAHSGYIAPRHIMFAMSSDDRYRYADLILSRTKYLPGSTKIPIVTGV